MTAVMQRRGVRGREKKINLEIKDGGEKFLTDCFPIQAMSSSCFALILLPFLSPVHVSCYAIQCVMWSKVCLRMV